MKIGRNAPCPCGSGKKYKKCCLNKTKEEKIIIGLSAIENRHQLTITNPIDHGHIDDWEQVPKP